MVSPVCLWRAFWLTLRSAIASGDATPIEGHAYREEYSGVARVSVLRCEQCGRYSVGWERLPEEVR